MTGRWWLREGVGLVDDEGTEAVPSHALRTADPGSGAELWLEVPTTRWGGRHRALEARANMVTLEALYPCVQRVLAVTAGWRCLMVRDVDSWRLAEHMDILDAGRVVSEATYLSLLRRLLRERIERVEAMDAADRLPELLAAAGAADAGRMVSGRLDEEALVRAYLVLAADTPPVPVADALDASVPAHEVVVDRLVSAVAKRPELVTVGEPLGGAPTWAIYERWVLG